MKSGDLENLLEKDQQIKNCSTFLVTSLNTDFHNKKV